ncbi:multiple C2 and transmembrane domain-containing protein isoform X1 [Phlebotomus papatasi]|nr:multiple C2 and transmembrane domain-containing protein isoform X1 [Phlebotomus papatasi]XP_055701212.1 multiple C2 and transmembrane domain-containing protein isoform X1 [Phlebotomus papatasi]XP_055701213.1 multiple C2 and transmembrane domain-containing protein isoform X1 [Phlebotomus papatasi]XP_055701214.1 multiple C2 and transmembrane domain-containing protein isoform X1 [Phlebotomus papatasi]
MADSLSTEKKSRLNQEAKCSILGKHLSKSASELSCRDCSVDSPSGSPHRTRSIANPAVSGVLQKTHGFFNTLKHRLGRGRSKERGRRSPQDGDIPEKRESTDYAADNSSDHSSSVTPLTQSPRHRATTIGESPLTRADSSVTKESSILKGFLDKGRDNEATSSKECTLEFLQTDEAQKRREIALRQHAFFQLRIHLLSGHDLVAMDKNGTSDPYVKFKVGGRLLYKSRTVHRDLNPVWDETFVVPIEDPFQPINIKVFDYDWGLQDDFMGSAQLDLTSVELCRAQEIVLKLEDPSRSGRTLGEIKLNITLWPRTQEDKEQYFQRHPKLADASKRLKSQIWSSVVTIVLVEARGLPPDPEGSLSEPYVKFRLGNEKYKSKCSWRSRWLEQFDLHLFDEEQNLEVSVWRRNVQLGKCIIDLRSLPRERTHGMWQTLEDLAGSIFLLLTISGTTASETITDLTNYKEDPRERLTLEKRYHWHRCFQNLRDVGHLTVKIFGATGLAAADLGGKSDPFCVLELINARLQTQTEYKTLSPNWNKIFTFNVKDMTSVLEVTVFDEDRDHKVEFLGKLAIPLLRIRNGEKRWYALKDKKLFSRAKGVSPQILMELTVIWSPVRAAIRALEPREEKLVQQEAKFKRQLFLRNVSRLKEEVMYVLDCGRWIQSCFEWEYPMRSFFALVFWICGCIWFDVSTIPALMLLLLLKNWFVKWITGPSSHTVTDEYDMASDDEDDDDKEKEEKKTIKERLQAIQEVSQTVQNTIGYLASLGESVKNTFNFSVPELSWLAAILLFLGVLVLHFVPMRIILLLWGIVKFSRRLVRPHSVPNNEVLDLLSRVPDDDELIMFRELVTHSTPEMTRRDPRKKMKAA